jgi:hypothetical protein
VFSAPPVNEAAVVATPEVRYEPPALEPAPRSLTYPSNTGSPAPAVSADAPVIFESPQRVPNFPRPLDGGRPVDTATGTQMYRPDAQGQLVRVIPPSGGSGSFGGSARSEGAPTARDVGGNAPPSTSLGGPPPASGSPSGGNLVTISPRGSSADSGHSGGSTTVAPPTEASGSANSPSE